MKQITFNPSNEPYYSEDFIKGFKCGAERQFEADKKDKTQGEWIKKKYNDIRYYECEKCNGEVHTNCYYYCPWCGARMKGADDE